MARVAVAQPAVGDHGEEGGREAAALEPRAQDAVGLREHLRRVLGVPGARLDEEAHHRARGGDLEALAADVAHEHRDRAARLRPDAEDVAAADLVGDRLVDQPELQAGLRVGRPGDEAARERPGDPALVLELERVRDRAGRADAERDQPPQVRVAEAPGQVVRGAQHAEQPPAERDRDVDERAHALRLDHPAHEAVAVLRRRDVRLAGGRGAADHPLAELEAGARQLLGEAAAGDPAQVALAGVVAGQQHLGRARQLARLLDDRGVDGLEVDRGRDRAQRPVDEALLPAQAGLALEQLGAFERQRGQPREHLDRAQVLGVERASGGLEEIASTPNVRPPAVRTGHEMNEAVR